MLYEYHLALIELIVSCFLLLAMVTAELIRTRIQDRFCNQVRKWKMYLKQKLTSQPTRNLVKNMHPSRDFVALLTALEDFDHVFSDAVWVELKQELAAQYLLPWMRASYNKKKWHIRHLAARILLLLPLRQDLFIMERLLEDNDFYIRMVACEAIGKLNLPVTMPILIEKMAQEPPLSRFIYRYVLHNTSELCFNAILNYALQASSDHVLLCCLDVLSYRVSQAMQPFLHSKLAHPSLAIRQQLAVMLSRTPSELALQDLLVLTRDPEQKVRQSALQALRAWQDERSFHALEQALHDPVYTVRLQAALTLRQYGTKGLKVLALQDSDLHPLAHDVARFVLTMP